MTVKKQAQTAEKAATPRKAPRKAATPKRASQADPVLFARENGLDERTVRNLLAFKGSNIEAARFFGVDEATVAKVR